MAAKFLELACLRRVSYGDLSPAPHYPSMPTKYPKGVSEQEKNVVEGSESRALFSVTGMTCSACAGSVEKAIKRLPGIKEAVVDVINGRALVLFYPSFVDVSQSLRFSSRAGSCGILMNDCYHPFQPDRILPMSRNFKAPAED